MNWYYLDTQQKRIGPISESDIQNLVSNGTLTKKSQVWNETLTEWTSVAQTSLATICPTATPPPPPPGAPSSVGTATTSTKPAEITKIALSFWKSVKCNYTTEDILRLILALTGCFMILVSVFIPFGEVRCNGSTSPMCVYSIPPALLTYFVLTFGVLFSIWNKKYIVRFVLGILLIAFTAVMGNGSQTTNSYGDSVILIYLPGIAVAFLGSFLVLASGIPKKWIKQQNTPQ